MLIATRSVTRRSAPKITRNVKPMTTMMEIVTSMMDSAILDNFAATAGGADVVGVIQQRRLRC